MFRIVPALALCAAVIAPAMAEPQVWVSSRARGTATTDTRFDQMVHYDMKWGMHYGVNAPPYAPYTAWEGASLPPPPLVARSADQTAKRIAREVIARGYVANGNQSNPDLAIMIDRFAMRGVEPYYGAPANELMNYNGTSVPDDALAFPSLYTDPDDMITVNGVQFRTPWTTTGISKTLAWTQNFVTAYNTTGAAKPSRIVFDQEIPPILAYTPELWQTILDYWAALKADTTKYNTRLIPGFDVSLNTLWSNSGLAEPGPLVFADRYKIIGGSAANEAWFRWLCGVNHQASMGALDQAVFQPVVAAWPGCRGSDYDGSLKTYGMYRRDYAGVYGGGFNYPLTQDVSRMVNTMHCYPDVAGWLWHSFGVANTDLVGPPGYDVKMRWRNTKDNAAPLYGLVRNGFRSPRHTDDAGNIIDYYVAEGEEFWEECSLRMNRAQLENCLRKNITPTVGGSPTSPLAVWIQLPFQPNQFASGDVHGQYSAVKTYAYDGLLYNANNPSDARLNANFMPVRQSAYGLYRTLAACRSHGVNEFMVWNDTGPDADAPNTTWNGEGFYNQEIHPDYSKNWETLQRAVSQVFDFNCTSASASTGTLSVPSGTTAVNCLKLCDEGVPGETLGSRSVKVTSAVGGAAAVNLFFQRTRTFTPAPARLNFEIEMYLDLPGVVFFPSTLPTITVAVYNYQTGQYESIGNTTLNKDQDGKIFGASGTTAAFRMPIRLRTSLPYANKVSTGGESRVKVTVAGTSGYASALMIDNALCYTSEDVRRHRCDLNADGVVDVKDDQKFTQMYNMTIPPGSNSAGTYRNFIDFNRNGVVGPADPSDKTTWDAMYAHALAVPNDPQDIVDDYRQPSNDVRPAPARTLP